jgi:hypothetical protein
MWFDLEDGRMLASLFIICIQSTILLLYRKEMPTQLATVKNIGIKGGAAHSGVWCITKRNIIYDVFSFL